MMRRLLTLLLLFPIGIIAQTSLSTPYDAIYNHLYFLQEDNYNPSQSAESLPDLTDYPDKEKLAIQLKQILDGKGLYVNINAVPDKVNYTDSTTNKNIYYISLSEPRIYLKKTNNQWQYADETVASINEMYKEVYPLGTSFFQNLLPFQAAQKKLFGLFLWQWTGILFIIIVGLILYYILSLLVKKILQFFIHKKSLLKEKNEAQFQKIARSFSVFVVFYSIYKLIPSLQLAPQLLQYLVKGLAILLIFLFALMVKRIIEYIVDSFSSIVEKTSSKLDDQLLPVVKKLSNFLILVIAASLALKQLNVNLTAIIAGLSIGGLALALASQDTVKNFIGSVTIFVDHPFEIGDYIQLSGTEGTVEEVGMRATRIRTPNQSVAYIPNGELSNMIIDNMGLRVFRRWKWLMGVEYNLSPNKLDEFCVKAKQVINEFDFVAKENTVVRLHELGDSSINIFVNIFLDVPTYNEELACKHDVLLALMRLAEEMNVGFAFPTQTLYLKQEGEN